MSWHKSIFLDLFLYRRRANIKWIKKKTFSETNSGLRGLKHRLCQKSIVVKSKVLNIVLLIYNKLEQVLELHGKHV